MYVQRTVRVYLKSDTFVDIRGECMDVLYTVIVKT